MLTQKDTNEIEDRRVGLELFLRRLMVHPSVCQDEHLMKFLTSDDWNPLKVSSSSKFSKITDWGLSKVKEPNDELLEIERRANLLKGIFEVFLNQFESVQSNGKGMLYYVCCLLFVLSGSFFIVHHM